MNSLEIAFPLFFLFSKSAEDPPANGKIIPHEGMGFFEFAGFLACAAGVMASSFFYSTLCNEL